MPPPYNVVPYNIKLSYYAFMAFLLPTYTIHYPLVNYFNLCIVHLNLVLISFITDKPIFISMSAIGISVIQLAWSLDFLGETLGFEFLGATTYMYNENLPVYLRSLSLFHAWFPFLLFYLLKRIGYDQRALCYQLVLSNSLCLLSYCHTDLYNQNINRIKDFPIYYHLILFPIAIFITHKFLLWVVFI
jgi:hypothetical protein